MYIKRITSKLTTTSLLLRRDSLIWALRCNNWNPVRNNTVHKYLGDWAIAIRGQSTRIKLHQQMTQMWHCTETYSNGVRDSLNMPLVDISKLLTGGGKYGHQT